MTDKIQTQHLTTAHSLYMLYETLPDEIQQLFLQELMTKQAEKIKAKKAMPEGESHFRDLFGLLTASETASLEDMEQGR
jgi:hypothetical protein